MKVPAGSVKALLPAGAAVFAAGPAKVAAPGRGVVRAYAAGDGSLLGESRLDGAAVFDGLAAAGGRLYVATEAGQVICLGVQ